MNNLSNFNTYLWIHKSPKYDKTVKMLNEAYGGPEPVVPEPVVPEPVVPEPVVPEPVLPEPVVPEPVV